MFIKLYKLLTNTGLIFSILVPYTHGMQNHQMTQSAFYSNTMYNPQVPNFFFNNMMQTSFMNNSVNNNNQMMQQNTINNSYNTGYNQMMYQNTINNNYSTGYNNFQHQSTFTNNNINRLNNIEKEVGLYISFLDLYTIISNKNTSAEEKINISNNFGMLYLAKIMHYLVFY